MGRKSTVYKAYAEILIWFIIIKKVKWMFRKAQELATSKKKVAKLENLNYSALALAWDNPPCNKAIFPLEHYSHKTKWGSIAQQNQILENIICAVV